jgi:erythronate-4-phosphate dehydrogenase
MKIVVDENIPLLKGLLEPYAQVVYAAGSAIDAALVKDATALLIRTRTHCHKALLENSSVQFIGTATVGTDHIDLPWCREHRITVCSAAGSNAAGVMQYVITAMLAIAHKTGQNLPDCSLGIIGVGNIGKLVDRAATALGMQTLLNDPPRAAREGKKGFVSLDYLLEKADIITVHVPLTDDTNRFIGPAFFERLGRPAVFINTSRGEVVDEKALLQHREQLSHLVIDVWQNEPHINPALLQAATIATPHIAGYSAQGKRNATAIIVRELARYFGIAPLTDFSPMEPETVALEFPGSAGSLAAFMEGIYPVFEDDRQLRRHPEGFEQLRNGYRLRNDFSAYTLKVADEKLRIAMQQIGFKTIK